MHPLSKRFHDLLDVVGKLHDAKQADYGMEDDPFYNVRRGAEEWGVRPWVGAMMRLNDKVKRLQAYARKGSLANEPPSESFLDIAVYALIAHILQEEE